MKKIAKQELKIPSKIFFDPCQRTLYRLQVKRKLKKRLPGCVYQLWHLLRGRGSLGEFPLVVVRSHFAKLGYTVLCSSSYAKTPESFICTSYSGLRRQKPMHPAYRRMVKIFGLETLEKFNAIAEEEKSYIGKRGGGDPDLFIYKGNGHRVRFFVEVKHNDDLSAKQKLVFRLMRRHLRCPVYVIWIESKARA